MRVILMALISTLLIGLLNPLYGHGGHKHESVAVSETKIEDIAHRELVRLARSNKIAKSWLKAPHLQSMKKIFAKRAEWVVSYKNKNIPSPTNQILYIFVSMQGEIKGANYSGK